MNTFKLTSSVKKFPDSTVELSACKFEGFTQALIFHSAPSPGFDKKYQGTGNQSCMIKLASSHGDSSICLNPSYPSLR